MKDFLFNVVFIAFKRSFFNFTFAFGLVSGYLSGVCYLLLNSSRYLLLYGQWSFTDDNAAQWKPCGCLGCDVTLMTPLSVRLSSVQCREANSCFIRSVNKDRVSESVRHQITRKLEIASCFPVIYLQGDHQ